jgi:hypothetical protein
MHHVAIRHGEVLHAAQRGTVVDGRILAIGPTGAFKDSPNPRIVHAVIEPYGNPGIPETAAISRSSNDGRAVASSDHQTVSGNLPASIATTHGAERFPMLFGHCDVTGL